MRDRADGRYFAANRDGASENIQYGREKEREKCYRRREIYSKVFGR